jgi:hypothetical protein
VKTHFPLRIFFPLLLAGATGTVMAADASTVTVTAEPSVASEEGPAPGIFKFTRGGIPARP